MRTVLKPQERVSLEVRKHWWYVARVIPVFAALLVLVLWLWGRVAPEFSYLGVRGILQPLLILITVVAILTLAYLYRARRVNIWIVTDQRVIAEQGVFTHVTKESPIDKIHNISHRQSLFGRLFGYGDVIIQTAAEEGATCCSLVANPVLLKESLTAMQAARKKDLQPAGGTERGGIGVATDTKECPYCAETIKAKATICRFCGHELKEMRTGT